MATTGFDQMLRVWSLDSGNEPTLVGSAKISAVNMGHAWSPTGHQVAVGAGDGIAIYGVGRDGLERAAHYQTEEPYSIAWSPNSALLASGQGADLVVLDAKTGLEILRKQVHGHDLWSVAWSPDSKRVATGSFDQFAKICDVASGQVLHELVHPSGVVDVAFSPDGKRLACATEGQTIDFWDPETGKHISTQASHTDWVRAVDFSPQGDKLVSCSTDRSVRMWNLPKQDQDSSSGVSSESINRTRGYATYGRTNRTLAVRELSTRKIAYELPGERGFWSCDGKRIATQHEQQVRVADADTGRQMHSFSTDGSSLVIGWSGDDGLLLTHNAKTKTFRAWNAQTGHSHPSFYVDSFVGAAWQPNGRLLGVWTDSQFNVWDPVQALCLVSIPNSDPPFHVQHFAWSPDGSKFVTNHGSHLAIWEATSGRRLHRLVGHNVNKFLKSVLWSGDGSRIVSAGHDHMIKFWDPLAGREVASIDGHVSKIRSAVLSPNASRLASADWMGTVRLWDPDSGDELLLLGELAQGGKHQLLWSNDGQQLYHFGGSGASVYDASDGYAMVNDGRINELVARNLYEHGIMRAQSARVKESQRLFDRAGSLIGQSAWAYAARARKFRSVGKYAEAIRDFEVAVSLLPADAESENELAWLLATRRDGVARDPQRALTIAQRLVDQYPEEGHFLATLGLAQYRLAKFSEAKATLHRAMKFSRNHEGHARILLAAVYFRASNPTAANELLQEPAPLTSIEAADPSYRLDCDEFLAEASTISNDLGH